MVRLQKGFWGDSVIRSFGGVGGMMHPVINGTISRVVEGGEVQQPHDIHTHAQSDTWTHTCMDTDNPTRTHAQTYIHTFVHTQTQC